MGDFFIGEIRAFPYGVVPHGWHSCDGAILQISQNAALYSLLGTRFGGDGKTTFALPDLRGRAMLGFGQQGSLIYKVGDRSGMEAITLTQSQIPAHSHSFQGDKALGTANNPNPALPATQSAPLCYASQAQSPAKNMATNTISTVGGQGHNNVQPSLVLNYCISTTGIYPSRQ